MCGLVMPHLLNYIFLNDLLKLVNSINIMGRKDLENYNVCGTQDYILFFLMPERLI